MTFEAPVVTIIAAVAFVTGMMVGPIIENGGGVQQKKSAFTTRKAEPEFIC